MKRKKFMAFFCVVTMSCGTFGQVNAEAAPYTIPKYLDIQESSDAKEKEVLYFTLEAAVAYGLNHNPIVKSFDNKIELAKILYENTSDNVDDLQRAEEKLDDATILLSSKEKELKEGQVELNIARNMLNMGLAPSDIPLPNPAGGYYLDTNGNPIVIPVGASIHDTLAAILVSMGMEVGSETFIGTLATMENLVVEGVQDILDEKQTLIDESDFAIDEAKETLSLKRSELNLVLEDISEEVDAKLNYSSLVTLDVDGASDLMLQMADVNLDVTRYAKDIYRQQIAMLIQKNYYDALYAEKIVEVKENALLRGEKQYDLITISYENGMKAKDEWLLSKMYYKGTLIDLQLAKSTYQNALTELKKNMNLNQDQEILLEDTMVYQPIDEELQDGLKSGRINRFEVQKVLGQLEIYRLNEELITDLYTYKKDGPEVTEAQLLTQSMEIELEEVQAMVEGEIRSSYELMKSTQNMLIEAQVLLDDAKQVVEIAKVKYEQGFGEDNALLRSLNLETSTGTIVEVLAAQEKLAEVEASVANIYYSYTMATIKYYNDCGMLNHR